MLNKFSEVKNMNRFEEEKYIEIIEKCYQQGAGYFEEYFRKKMGRKLDASDQNVTESYLYKEFIAKAQFFQHTSGFGEGYDNFVKALPLAVEDRHLSFSHDKCGTAYDGFLHFIISNEKDTKFLGELIKQWIEAGRNLTEIHEIAGQQLTPLEMPIYHNKIEAFELLRQNNVDVTVLDKDGFSTLHRIIAKINNKTMKISALKLWVKNGLPIDTKDKEGYDAIYYAKKFELQEAVQLLEGRTEITEDASKIEHESLQDAPKKDQNFEDSLTYSIIKGDYEFFDKNFNENLKIYRHC